MKVTRQTIVADILDRDGGTAVCFKELGMRCFQCSSARGETIEEACRVRGSDCETLLKRLDDYFANL